MEDGITPDQDTIEEISGSIFDISKSGKLNIEESG